MGDKFWEIAAQAPALSVLAVIVYFFIKHLGKAAEVMQSIGDECHAHGKNLDERYAEVVNRNTDALDKVHGALGETTAYLRKQNGKH